MVDYTDGELSDQSARALGLFLDGPEKWEPLNNQVQADLIEKRLNFTVHRPLLPGHGTVCGAFTVFRDDVGVQNRRAVVLAAAAIGRTMQYAGYTQEEVDQLNAEGKS